MSLARVKVWIPGDVLTAADLNAEFNNVLNNPISLISPTTGQINFAGNQALSFTLENLTVSPASAFNGRIYDNTARQQLEFDNGTAICSVPTITLANTTPGALVYGSTGSAWLALPIGSSGQVLTVTSSNGLLAWGANAASTATVDTIIDKKSGPITSTALTTIYSFATTAGSLGSSGALKLTARGQGGLGGGTVTFGYVWGATTVSRTYSVAHTSGTAHTLEMTVSAWSSATNAQMVHQRTQWGTEVQTDITTTSTADSTVSQTLAFTVSYTAPSTTTNYYELDHVVLERI